MSKSRTRFSAMIFLARVKDFTGVLKKLAKD